MTTTAETRWYAVQTYSGHENKVQKLIQRRIAEEPEEGEIHEVLVPTQEVVEIRNGKRVDGHEAALPRVRVGRDGPQREDDPRRQQRSRASSNSSAPGGCRSLSGRTRSTRSSASKSRSEDEAHEEIPFHIDQVVEVMKGPFTDFSGKVQEVYPEKGKVKVEVSLFGRPTSVELDYTDLKGY